MKSDNKRKTRTISEQADVDMNLSPNVSPTKQQKTTRMTTLDHWMKKDKSNDRVVDESMNSSPNELKDTESVHTLAANAIER